MTPFWYDFILEDLSELTGPTTIMFVFDTTGSMGTERINAINIIKEIANMELPVSAEYILSGFNDPAESLPNGPLHWTDDLSVLEGYVDALTTSGGGFCREEAFTGMKNALDALLFTSPNSMFVFTDAPAKDGHLYDEVYKKATGTSTTDPFPTTTSIYFFINKGCLSTDPGWDDYDDLAAFTGGRFRLKHFLMVLY